MSFYLEDDKFRKVMELCYHHYDIDAYDKAIGYARKAIEMAPEHWEGYHWIARSILKQYDGYIDVLDRPVKLFSQAYKSAKLAVKCEPEQSANWCALGRSAYAIHKLTESQNAHLKAISLEDDCSGCWAEIAQCIVEKKRFKLTPKKEAEIMNYFNQSIKLHIRGAGGFWNQWGYVWKCCGDIKRAEEYFFRELKENPQNTVTLNNIGEIILARGDKNEAEKWFRNALQIAPNNKHFYRNLKNCSI